jgi:hypothetical protein
MYSCKKEVGTTPLATASSSDDFKLSLTADSSKSTSRSIPFCTYRLTLPTINDYRNLVDTPSVTKETAIINAINLLPGYTSWNEAHPNDTLFNSNLFGSILNADGVVQIGANVFRIDPIMKKVFVLPLANIVYYADLIAQYPQTGKVIMFSTDDEVLSLIEAGALDHTQVTTISSTYEATSGTIATRSFWSFIVSVFTGATNSVGLCNDHRVTNKTDIAVNAFGAFDVAAAYLRNYGLYTTLYAQMELGEVIIDRKNPYNFGFDGGISANLGYVYYKRRCDNTVSYSTVSAGSYAGTTGPSRTNFKYQSYQGSRALSKVYFCFRVYYYNSGGYALTRLIGFKDGI